jgi:hypothetical protein
LRQGLPVLPKVVLNSSAHAILPSLLSAGVTGEHHHAQLISSFQHPTPETDTE